jgi:hypothetical protein
MSEKVNTWNQLLQSSLKKQQIVNKNLLVLGSLDSDRSALVNKIKEQSCTMYTSKYDYPQTDEDNPIYSGIDYTYFDYQDDENNARINVYQVDSIKQQ